MGRQVVALGSWRLSSDGLTGPSRVHAARDPSQAAEIALRLAAAGPAEPA